MYFKCKCPHWAAYLFFVFSCVKSPVVLLFNNYRPTLLPIHPFFTTYPGSCRGGSKQRVWDSRTTSFDSTTTATFSRIASHPIFKGEPSHPTQEAHFSPFYLRFRSFGHYSETVTIGKSRNEDWPVNREVCLLAQLSLHPDHTHPPVDLPPQFLSPTHGAGSPHRSEPWPQIWRC